MNTKLSMRPRVLVTGAFDDLRSGDLRFLEEAAKLGKLTVRLWSDEKVRQHSDKPPKFPQDERLYLLQGIRFVSNVELVSGDEREETRPVAPGGQPQIWAIHESEAGAAGTIPGRTCRVIHNADLRGFPGGTTTTLPADSGAKKVP